MPRFLLILLAMLVGGLAAPVGAESRDHFRIVLDLSKSMRQNDPGRLAILATLLLHNLAQPNPTRGDSFKVIPFKSDWNWQDPAQPPPTTNGAAITAAGLDRASFADAIKTLSYDARETHFYPGIRAALDDLAATPKGDSRVIVLVTDGVPERRTQAREAQAIEKELLPRLEAEATRLYVLAFSAEAIRNKAFFDLMTRNDTLGRSFFDADGSRLLETMLELFGESLGYQVDRPAPLPGPATLALNPGGSLPRAAVVVVANGAATAPGLRLSPPPTLQHGLVSEVMPGAAYTLAWVLSPAPGPYAFTTAARRGSVAVLRPIRVRLAVGPAPPHTQAARTMAGQPLPLRVAASNEYGGATGPLDLRFQLSGPGWEERPQAPPAPAVTAPDGAGVLFQVPVVFPEGQPPDVVYRGAVTVEASRGLKVLGRLAAPHPVEVYPLLALAPFPRLLEMDPDAAALHRGDRRCARFRLMLNGGRLPAGTHTLRAELVPTDPASVEEEFRNAVFQMDGIPLRFAGQPGAGGWEEGRPLDLRQLLEETHEICLRVGAPRRTDPARPLDLPLRLSLAQSPYDDFDVIAPLILRLRLAAPVLAHLDGVLLALLGVWMLATLWHFRGAPRLAPDLAAAIGPDDPAGTWAPALPLAFSGWRSVFRGERAIRDGNGRTVAWVQPREDTLYSLRLPPGGRLESQDGGTLLIAGSRVTIAVHRSYRLTLPDRPGACRLRLEFLPGSA